MFNQNNISVRRDGRVLRFVFDFETQVYDFRVVRFENWVIGDILWHLAPQGSRGLVGTTIETMKFAEAPDISLNELTELTKEADVSPVRTGRLVREFVYGVAPQSYSTLRPAVPLGVGTYGYIARTPGGESKGPFSVLTSG
jgi:hypothetical protein